MQVVPRQLRSARALASILLALLALSAPVLAQDAPVTQPFDPVADATGAPLESSLHQPLPEQYIWTAPSQPAASSDRIAYVFPTPREQTEPHFFRTSFTLDRVPAHATLYIAGPRSAEVYLNGHLVENVSSDITQPLAMHVFATAIESFLVPGRNVLALQVVRGRGVTGFTNSALVMQQTFGEVLVAKIIPRERGILAPALLLSGPEWKSTTDAAPGWQAPTFDDTAWKPIQALGGIEHTLDLFQWNADAGLYDWPGYDGISPFLAHRLIPAHAILSIDTARSTLANTSALTTREPTAPLIVHLSAPRLEPQNAPSIILDFGQELTGRLQLVSASGSPAEVAIQYGESYDALLKDPYLGVNLLYLAPHATGHGPKSSFRYAKIAFVAGAPDLAFSSIAVDDIFYPVQYRGSFESSDPMLNRIWQVGAYTAHLCMQDDIWDSPKRDRGRWMGDTDVMGRTIDDVFLDRFLMEDTLDRLLGPAPVRQHVNGIPGYSAFWFTGVAEYVRHTGDIDFLRRTHQRMLELLAYVDKEFDQNNLYANKTGVWLFVDWSPELNGDTAETRRATTLEFYAAYRDAAFLLNTLGDTANAARYEQRAAQIKSAAQAHLLDPATGSFGARWQTNAMAVLSGVADPAQYASIWQHSLSSVGHIRYNSLVTTPYYGYYILTAMAEMDHREAALEWMRQYWGGMLAEGASSFWEAYDPDWFKQDFHASLQADNRSGYFVSLAHGWSSGSTAWLLEQVLGIRSTGPGFSSVTIRPDLLDLQWARGSEPTPRGPLSVSLSKDNTFTATIDLPPSTRAEISLPVPRPGAQVLVNGRREASTSAENGTRALVTLDSPGHFILTAR